MRGEVSVSSYLSNGTRPAGSPLTIAAVRPSTLRDSAIVCLRVARESRSDQGNLDGLYTATSIEYCSETTTIVTHVFTSSCFCDCESHAFAPKPTISQVILRAKRKIDNRLYGRSSCACNLYIQLRLPQSDQQNTYGVHSNIRTAMLDVSARSDVVLSVAVVAPLSTPWPNSLQQHLHQVPRNQTEGRRRKPHRPSP